MKSENGKIRIIHLVVIGVILLLLIVFFAIKRGIVIDVEPIKEGIEPKPVIEKQVESKPGPSELDFEFLKMNNNKENMIYSPLSIEYALSMLEEGANGDTKEEIDNVLKFKKLPTYENIENVLSLANAVFVRETEEEYVKESYIQTINDKFKAELYYDSFENANTINNWVNDKTFGIIKEILADEALEYPVGMVLVNALAIDMEWKYNFGNVFSREFTLEDGNKMLDASTMSEKFKLEDVKYLQEKDVSAVEIPLKEYAEGKNLSVILIMPEKDSLENYVKDFSCKKYTDIIKDLKSASNTNGGVLIQCPLFDYEYEVSLKDNLQELGINKAFVKEEADFRDICDTHDYVWVSDAFHKAKIEYSNKGIKAAAATAITMAMTDSVAPKEPDPIEMIFDKPFMYVIKDESEDGTIWFVGTLYEPDKFGKENIDNILGL